MKHLGNLVLVYSNICEDVCFQYQTILPPPHLCRRSEFGNQDSKKLVREQLLFNNNIVLSPSKCPTGSLGLCSSSLNTLGPMPGGGPRLDRRVRIQLGRIHFVVFSTSRFVPLALSSDWTWPALSSVICHSGGIPTDWKWWFFVTDSGSQLTFYF